MEQSNEMQNLLSKRQEMLKRLGVKNVGTMNESVVSNNGVNSNTAAKLAAIRNGSAKAELNKFMNATGKSAPGEFQGIPEPTKRKNPNQAKEEVKPEYKQKLESFSAPSSNSDSHELNAIESMFGGDGPSRASTNGGSQMMAQNPMNQELNMDSMVMPSFNPQAALQQKVRSQTQNQIQNQPQNNQYLKYASDTPPVTNEQFVEVGQNNQPMFNTAQLQIMMETIAKGIAEKTIRNVLNEYSEQQKGKVFFEYYNKEKGIIKTTDGKYYRLTQVELKKK